MADKIKVRFHVAGVIAILLGAGGAFLSLFWDVIYKGKAFSLSAVGPFKLLGLAAALAIIIAGVIVGLVLGRRISSQAGPGGMPAPQKGYGLIGYLLVLGGLGGTFLSLWWDVIRRGRPFSIAAIGPMKIMGILAGIVIMVIGIVIVVVLARRKPAVQTGMPSAAAIGQSGAVTQPQAAGIVTVAKQPVQAQDGIPFALPVEQAQAPLEGAVPLEAIPVEEP